MPTDPRRPAIASHLVRSVGPGKPICVPKRAQGNLRSKLAVLAAPYLALTLLGFNCACAWGEETPGTASDAPLVREIFVPFEDLDVLVEAQPKRVFLSREEYSDLLRKAHRSPRRPAPQGVLLVAADYEATISEGRAFISGTLTIESLEDGLQKFRLDLQEVGVRQATLDNELAAIGRSSQGSGLDLFVPGRGRHVLQLDLVVPLESTATQQSLDFGLPVSAATRLGLNVPGNVELRSGAAVLSREVDEAAETTQFELVPERGRTKLVLSLNNRFLRAKSAIAARSVVVDELTGAYERLHATFSLDVLHGAVERLRFSIPHHFEITTIKSRELSRWAVSSEPDHQVLEIELRDATTDEIVLSMLATKNGALAARWQMPQIVPLDVNRHVSVVGLLLEDRLRASSVTTEKLIPIDTAVLNAAVPDTFFHTAPGSPTVRPVVAHYAPRAGYRLLADIHKPAAQFAADVHVLLTLDETGESLRSAVTTRPRLEKQFQTDILIPSDWDVQRVFAQDGKPLLFDRLPTQDATPPGLRVRFPSGISPGESFTFYVEATRSSADWLADWAEQEIDIPQIILPHASSQQGAVAVEAHHDFDISPSSLLGLIALEDRRKSEFGLSVSARSLAYLYRKPDYSASMTVTRREPRITARILGFLRLQAEGLAAHCELTFHIEQARTRAFVFSLPDTTPADISIRGLDGVVVKQQHSQVSDGFRRWTVQLAAARRGRVRLSIDFQQKIPDEFQGLALPVARAEEVDYQTGILAVEGKPGFDASVTTAARRADVGELVDAEYQVGRRLLGVFGLQNGTGQVLLDAVRRPEYGMPAAIIERCELVTSAGTTGLCQTVARYLLRTRTSFLEIRLPANAELWSASVDDTPAVPHRDGRSLLLHLPVDDGQSLRDLQIVYQTPGAGRSLLADIQTTAPFLVVRDDGGGDGFNVPIADVVWHLILPSGHRLIKTQGTVVRESPPRPTSPLPAAGRLLYGLGGGWQARTAPTGGAVNRQFKSTAEPLSALGTTLDDIAEGVTANEESFDEMRAPQTDAEPSLGLMADAPTEPASGEAAPQAMPAEEDANKTAGPTQYWALQGVRSLPIQLDRSGEQIVFRSMGFAPGLRATLLDGARLDFVSWTLAIAVFAIGIALSRKSHASKAVFVVATMLVFLMLPLLLRAFLELDFGTAFHRPFYAAALLVPWYLIGGCLNAVGRTIRRAVATAPPAATLLLLAVAAFPPTGSAQEAPSEWNEILSLLKPSQVELPPDAIIVPYDATSATGVADADRVLVPYEKYLKLLSLADPNNAPPGNVSPVEFAVGSANYRMALTESDELVIQGRLVIDVFVDEDVEIPLPMRDAILTKAMMNGEPARIRVVAPQPPNPAVRQAIRSPQARAETVLVVYASGRGQKQLEFSLRMRLRRRGGWRMTSGRLPTAAATKLSIDVPSAETELRLRGVPDRTVFETRQPNQTIETSLAASGDLSLQWRPLVSMGQVDQTLTVNSAAVLDVQEDALRLTWNTQLALRRSQREAFTLLVPEGFLIEAVSGPNVRGWRQVSEEGRQRIEVTLLKPATESESLAVRLSRGIDYNDERPTIVEVPRVSIPDAVMHRGILLVRRSPLIDVQVDQWTGLSRADASGAEVDAVVASAKADSPLGIRSHQAFRFDSGQFSLSLSAQPVTALPHVESRALLKLGADEVVYEAKLDFTSRQRPVYQVVAAIPANFELTSVDAPGSFDWSITSQETSKTLTVFFQSGHSGTLPILLKGLIRRDPTSEVTPIPQLEVRDVSRQSGYLVVQVDPAINVRVEGLQNCELVLPHRVSAWLSREQRDLARLVLRHRGPQYAALIRTTPRQPQVSHFTIANIRTTPDEIETTLFFRFMIQQAGIREVVLQLPDWMHDAKFTVPQLRQKIVEPLPAQPGMIRVRLRLSDDVIGPLIILVERDRAMDAGRVETRLPVAETGRTDGRFVVLENAGRDEVVVEASSEINELSRQQPEWDQLAGVLGTAITQAFVVRESETPSSFVMRTQQRATVQTADARIRLAETLLLLDAQGAFRGSQSYRIDNKTEQYLQLELPVGASLWSALVAGQPVKPARVTGAAGHQQVRIPLLKTAQGDLDYEVRVKYGGRLRTITKIDRLHFPLIHTVNINVEESQVRLRLPESHRWYDFTGTMDRVATRGDLAAGFLSYQTRQIESLRRIVASQEVDKFARIRAASNLKKAVDEAEQYESFLKNEYRAGNQNLQQELLSNSLARRGAREQIAGSQSDDTVTFNRSRLRQLGEQQETTRSNDVVIQLGDNFGNAELSLEESQPSATRFREEWLKGHRLNNEQKKENGRRFSAPAQDSRRDKALADRIAGAAVQLASPDTAAQLGRKQDAQSRDADRDGDLSGQLYRYQQRLESSNQSAATRVQGQGGFAGGGIQAPEGESEPQVVDRLERTTEVTGGEVLGFHSLDVVFAERGHEFLFTTPRGETELAARAVRASLLEQCTRMLGIVGAALALFLAWRLLKWINRSLSPRVRGIALILIGLISLTGVFPVVGMLAIAAGAWLTYKSFVDSPPAANAAIG